MCLLLQTFHHAPSAVISLFGHVTDLNSSGLQGTSQVIELKLLHTAAVSYQCNVYQCDILLYWLVDRDPYNELLHSFTGMQLSMAMMPLNKHDMRFLWRVSQRKLPAVTRVQTKTKKQKHKHDLSQLLVEMYSIALPTGRPSIYNRIHNKVAWTTQAKCGFGGTAFDGLATTKFSKPTGLCEIKLTNHWSLEVPIQSEHWSFFLVLKV